MLLEVSELAVDVATRRGLQRVVDRTSFSLDEGESLGVVGESGSGKTMTALALMGLTPEGARVFGFDPLRGAGAGRPRRRGTASIARRSHRHDLPGADDGSQSAAPRRRASRRTADAASGLKQARGAGARGRVARTCATGRAGTRGAILSVPALWRRTAAGDDRHGDRLFAAPGHCRRADHGARRHGAGAHSRPHRRIARRNRRWRSCW